jgi:hypothetical protein
MLLLCAGGSLLAHRLDEYLQAATISVEKDRIQGQVRLTPGVAVFAVVLADLSLTLDGDRLRPQVLSSRFPKAEEMKEGLGEIEVDFDATMHGSSTNRTLIFQNHHQPMIAGYLVKRLEPMDPDIRVTSQNRNYEQSSYELKYVQDGYRFATWPGGPVWAGGAALVLVTRFAVLLRRRGRTSHVAGQREAAER